MGIVGSLVRYQLPRRSLRLGLLAVALTAALGSAGTLAAVGAADRTANAYGDYLDRAAVGDVVLNPSLVASDVDRLVRGLPGVEAVTSDALFGAGIDPTGAPRTQAELDADPTPVLVRGSTDGRYLTMDRPVVLRGRMPTEANEAFVTDELATNHALHLGDVVPLSFWSRRTEAIGDEGPNEPIGREELTITGIGRLADEVLPDGLYPRETLIVSPDIARRYDCLPSAPTASTPTEEAFLQLAPQACATSYRYYSLAVAGGSEGVAAALGAFTTGADELTAALPQDLLDQGLAFTLVGKTVTADELRRVDRSIQPIVAALAVLALVAAAITLLVSGLAIARVLARCDDDQRQWWTLGATRRDRGATLALPVIGAVLVGVVLGIGTAWLVSPLAPVGNVRSIAPSPARSLSSWSWAVALGLTVLLIVAAALLVVRAVHRITDTGTHRAAMAPRFARRTNRPEITEGVRAAYGTRRGAGVLLASGGTAVAIFVAAAVFGASLSSLLSTPASYGWSWDVAGIANFGYGGFDIEAASKNLDGRDDVAHWTALGFSNSTTLDDEPVPAVLGFDRSSTVDLPVVHGRLPVASDEIALGERTARDRGLGLGDQVTIAGYEVEPRTATIAGIVVLPAVGPFRADRTAPGVGVLVPEAMITPAGPDADPVPTFIGVDLRDGGNATAALADLRPLFASWDTSASTVFDFAAPVRPAEISDARSMRSTPLVVGALLVLGATVGLGIGIALSVRARRRELAILRSLGFTRRQLSDSVRVQALASVAGAVVIGVPLGVAIGRVAWRQFASQLGVTADPTLPVGWILATAIGAAVIALLAASIPARTAARTHPAVMLTEA